MLIKIKPLSVNQVWQGKRYKTKSYLDYQKSMISLMPKFKVNIDSKLAIIITFGFSTVACDIDNPVKPLFDIIQKKYGINDKNIYFFAVEKRIVKRGQEFIEIEIKEINDDNLISKIFNKIKELLGVN